MNVTTILLTKPTICPGKSLRVNEIFIDFLIIYDTYFISIQVSNVQWICCVTIFINGVFSFVILLFFINFFSSELKLLLYIVFKIIVISVMFC
jgi:hypothetical protein